MFGDVAVGFQKHALWCPLHVVPHGFPRVAHGTTPDDDTLGSGETIGTNKAILGRGQGARLSLLVGVKPREGR